MRNSFQRSHPMVLLYQILKMLLCAAEGLDAILFIRKSDELQCMRIKSDLGCRIGFAYSRVWNVCESNSIFDTENDSQFRAPEYLQSKPLHDCYQKQSLIKNGLHPPIKRQLVLPRVVAHKLSFLSLITLQIQGKRIYLLQYFRSDYLQ